MQILLLGASGFIGSALARALAGEGHRIVGLARNIAGARRAVPQIEWRQGDLRNMTAPGDWAGLLEGVEIVVNASGALQTGLRDDVGKVQEDAILAMIAAGEKAGLRHVVQISAAGADRQMDSPFMASKARADAALAASAIGHTILRPGLVIGRNSFGGNELLRGAAGLPLLAPEIGGTGAIQCVALSDVVEVVQRAVAEPAWHTGTFDLVEGQGRSLGEVIALHREWLGLAPGRRLALPVWVLRPVTLLADGLGWLGWRSPLRSNALAALANGVAGDAAQGEALLGRQPLALPEILSGLGAAGKADRWHAGLALLYPLALASLVLLWLGSGLLGLARLDQAAALLVAGGISAVAAKALVVAGSLADIAIGLGMLFRPLLPLALKAGVVLALAYLAGSLAVRPDLWLDPLGPMLKVLPVLALSAICLAMSGER